MGRVKRALNGTTTKFFWCKEDNQDRARGNVSYNTRKEKKIS